jgi:ketosteroid isomerase-like protein
LSQQWMEAAKQHDTKTLERLMAEDFTLVHPSQDMATPRPQWLSTLSRIETAQFRYEHLKVVHYGKTLAVVSAVLVFDAVIDGRPWPGPTTAVIDVWEKRGGKWQVVTRYAVRPEEIKVAAAASTAQPQTPSPAQTPTVPEEFAALSQQWMEAAQRQDAKTLERLMAKDFTLVHPSQDTVTTRTQWLATLTKIEWKRFRYQHPKVLHHGPTLAVASAVLRANAVLDGQPFTPKSAVIDVWEKRGGRWQVVTRYAVNPEDITRAASAAPN